MPAIWLDEEAFFLINGLAGRWHLLDAAMIALAQGGPIGLGLWLALLWFWPGAGRSRRRMTVVWGLLALVLAAGLGQGLGCLYYRWRPFLAHDVTLLVRAQPEASFPSLHPTVGSAVATVLGGLSRALGLAVWLQVVAVMWARVYVGVHYPADVLGGALLGWATGSIVRANRDVLRAFARRVVKTVERLLPF